MKRLLLIFMFFALVGCDQVDSADDDQNQVEDLPIEMHLNDFRFLEDEENILEINVELINDNDSDIDYSVDDFSLISGSLEYELYEANISEGQIPANDFVLATIKYQLSDTPEQVVLSYAGDGHKEYLDLNYDSAQDEEVYMLTTTYDGIDYLLEYGDYVASADSILTVIEVNFANEGNVTVDYDYANFHLSVNGEDIDFDILNSEDISGTLEAGESVAEMIVIEISEYINYELIYLPTEDFVSDEFITLQYFPIDFDEEFPSIGQIIDADGRVVQIISTEIADSYDFYTPAEGNSVLLVELAIKNNTYEDIVLNKTFFAVYTDYGEFVLLDIDFENKFDTMTVSSGEYGYGLVAFEIPSEAEEMLFGYDENSDYFGPLVIDLGEETEGATIMYTPDAGGDNSVENIVGTKVSVDDEIFQVINVERVNSITSGSSTITARDGRELIVVDILAKRENPGITDFFADSFKMKDDNGFFADPVSKSSFSEELTNLRLYGNGVAEFRLIFEEELDGELVLLYEPGYDDILIEINLEKSYSIISYLQSSFTPNYDMLIGDTAIQGKMKIQVLGTTSAGSYGGKTAPDGYSFLVVEVALENVSDEFMDYLSGDFQLVTSNGEIIMPFYTHNETFELDSEETSRVEIPYFVKDGYTGFGLIYVVDPTPDTFDENSDTGWDFTPTSIDLSDSLNYFDPIA